MVAVDARAEEFSEPVAPVGGLRRAWLEEFGPARGTQRGKAREFVVHGHVSALILRIATTDAHR
jgi:hypothetical protein